MSARQTRNAVFFFISLTALTILADCQVLRSCERTNLSRDLRCEISADILINENINCTCKSNCIPVKASCREDGSWNYFGKEKDCYVPAFHHFHPLTHINVSFNSGYYLFTCERGYQLHGPRKIQCVAGELLGSRPTCEYFNNTDFFDSETIESTTSENEINTDTTSIIINKSSNNVSTEVNNINREKLIINSILYVSITSAILLFLILVWCVYKSRKYVRQLKITLENMQAVERVTEENEYIEILEDGGYEVPTKIRLPKRLAK